MPLFSIIIPAYNRAALIGATLDSVLRQSFTDYEIIVVDDGSTDGTQEALRSYAARIRYLRQENQGPGAARNLGIREARGDYIAFLDSDDLWFPWTLSVYAEAIEQGGRPSFVAGRQMLFTKESEIEAVERAATQIDSYTDFYSTSKHGIWIITSAAAIKTQVLQALNGFSNPHDNAEDTDLWMRLGASPDFRHIQSPLVFAYRQHAGSAISNLERTYRGILYLVRQENTGKYPGGSQRRHARRYMLGPHVRAASVSFARAGRAGDAWRLYCKTFGWNLGSGRFRFLLALPFLIVLGKLGLVKNKPPG